jgi:hypothetical protein
MKEKPYKFAVRLPMSMRDRIAESAQLYRRSMNSEIVARLQESFSGLGLNQGLGHPIGNGNQINDHPGSGLNPQLERILRQQLDVDEEQILQGYRQLSKAKREALLKLLGNQ